MIPDTESGSGALSPEDSSSFVDPSTEEALLDSRVRCPTPPMRGEAPRLERSRATAGSTSGAVGPRPQPPLPPRTYPQVPQRLNATPTAQPDPPATTARAPRARAWTAPPPAGPLAAPQNPGQLRPRAPATRTHRRGGSPTEVAAPQTLHTRNLCSSSADRVGTLSGTACPAGASLVPGCFSGSLELGSISEAGRAVVGGEPGSCRIICKPLLLGAR